MLIFSFVIEPRVGGGGNITRLDLDGCVKEGAAEVSGYFEGCQEHIQ
jgi:hypothetical protein